MLNGKHWDRASIRFYFSVPATWDTAIVDEFCVLARRAGFGSQPGFDVKATLTEPHAVAAYTLSCEGFIEVSVSFHRKIFRTSFGLMSLFAFANVCFFFLQSGQTVLIIDAGGGTVVSSLIPRFHIFPSPSSNLQAGPLFSKH